jgi:hypothetical protein
MNVAAIQARLDDRYELFRRAAQMPEKASAPLLLHVFDEWLLSKNRALIVGQETLGWGLDPHHHRSACQNCPFKPITEFAEWIKSPDGTEALLHGYRVFDFAKTSPRNRRSPFLASVSRTHGEN